MASTSEVGHNKNVANYTTLYQILQEMGTLYNPSNTRIQLSNLDTIKALLSTAIGELNQKNPLYKNAVANREIAMAPLSKKISSVLNFFKSLDVSASDKENVSSIAKKIRGDKKAPKVNPETAPEAAISTSQMSYDSRIANFSTLIGLISSHEKYDPNEENIQLASLEAYHSQLTVLSQAVNEAGFMLLTARTNRNTILYRGETNVFSLSKDIKAYLKSLDAPGLPYYKAAVRLKFTSK
jgi:hypothetical protein